LPRRSDLAAATRSDTADDTSQSSVTRCTPRSRAHGTIELLDGPSRAADAGDQPGRGLRRLVRGRTERVPVSKDGRASVGGHGVPYPPGIPILMPGERAGTIEAVLSYLCALEDFDAGSRLRLTSTGSSATNTGCFRSSASRGGGVMLRHRVIPVIVARRGPRRGCRPESPRTPAC